MSNEFEEAIKNIDDSNVGHRKVKIITGKDIEEVTRRAAEFEKLHNVVDSKESTEKVNFYFIWNEKMEGYYESGLCKNK